MPIPTERTCSIETHDTNNLKETKQTTEVDISGVVIKANEQEQEISTHIAPSAIENESDNIVGAIDADDDESSQNIGVGAFDEENAQSTSPTSTEDEYLSATSGEDNEKLNAEHEEFQDSSYNSEQDDSGAVQGSNTQMIAIDIRVVQQRQEELERYQKLSAYFQGALNKREAELKEVRSDLNEAKEEVGEVRVDLNNSQQRCSALEEESQNATAQLQQVEQVLDLTRHALAQELERVDADEEAGDEADDKVSNDADEKQQLESELETQQKLCAGLRNSLVDRETKLENVKTELYSTKRQFAMLESDSDETARDLRRVQQELASTQQQLAQEQAKAPHAPHPAAGFDVQAMMTANTKLKTDYDHVYGMLNEVIRERDSLNGQLQNSRHQMQNEQFYAIQQQQQLANQIETANQLNDHLRANVEGMQGQINDLVRQKEAANDRVKQVEEYNSTLLDEYVVKYAQDPKEVEGRTICTPNEARDLHQALETSKNELERADRTNQELSDEMNKKTQQILRLEAEKDIMREQLVQSAVNFEICKNRIENYLETIPELVKGWVGMDVEDFEGLEANLQESQLHENMTIEALKEAATNVAEKETKLETLKRQQTAEFEVLNGQMGELRAHNIRLECENIQGTRLLTEKDHEIDVLKADVARAEDSSKQWRAQCETQAFGDNAAILQEAYSKRVNQADSRIEALQFKNWQLRVAVQQAGDDQLFNKQWARRKLAGIREQGYLLDWYQKQVVELKSRFREELLLNPLEIPFKPDFHDLPEEVKNEIRKKESGWIMHLTGWALEVGLVSGTEPRERTPMQIWDDIVAEPEDVMRPDRDLQSVL